MLIKRQFPEKTLVEFRDIAKCGSASEVKRMLSAIPAKVSRKELLDLLPESHSKLREIFSTHADPGDYDLYGTSLFGVSEIIRSDLTPSLLENGEFERFGELMKVSHDGDRVSGRFHCGSCEGLEYECGSYSCSTPRVDELCDLMNSTEGVLGSELAGAGLGGCVLILVRKEYESSAMKRLNEEFYDRLGLPRSAFVCTPSNGSGVFY
jgi:hypothetical protein